MGQVQSGYMGLTDIARHAVTHQHKILPILPSQMDPIKEKVWEQSRANLSPLACLPCLSPFHPPPTQRVTPWWRDWGTEERNGHQAKQGWSSANTKWWNFLVSCIKQSSSGWNSSCKLFKEGILLSTLLSGTQKILIFPGSPGTTTKIRSKTNNQHRAFFFLTKSGSNLCMLRNMSSTTAFQSHLLFPRFILQCRLSKCGSLGALWSTIPVNIYILSLPILVWNMLKGCTRCASAFYRLFALVSKSKILQEWLPKACCILTFLERVNPSQLNLILKNPYKTKVCGRTFFSDLIFQTSFPFGKDYPK